MLCDIIVTPAQLRAAADWAEVADGMARVELRTADTNLVVQQGDQRVVIFADGSLAGAS